MAADCQHCRVVQQVVANGFKGIRVVCVASPYLLKLPPHPMIGRLCMRSDRSFIPSQLLDSTLAMPQSTAVIVVRAIAPWRMRSDKLRWIPDGERTDWGIAIGRFYSFAPHHCAWM
jgi:hypothetical protein